MGNILSETVLTLTRACGHLPAGRNDVKPHLSTLMRWITRGVKGGGGRPIRLEAARIGSRWVTSKEALGRFIWALTYDKTADDGQRGFTPAQRRRAADNAGAQLEKVCI